jgi:hypothetical protein
LAQRFRLGCGEVAVEGEEAEPGEQVAGDGGGLAPGGVDLVVPGREMTQAGGLAAADPGLGSVAGSGELGLAARGAGGGDLVPLALVLFEQGQLRAGVRVLAADQDPHVRRPLREPVAAGGAAQQPGQLRDLRVRPGRPVGIQGRAPCRFGQARQHAADPLVEVEPDRVMNLVAGAGVQRG